MDPRPVTAVVEKHGADRRELISILEEIQAKLSYLPEEALRVVAERTGCPLVDVYGVATFYRAFSLVPRGKHLCSVCVGTACHVRGAPAVAEEMERRLEVKAGATTADRQFTLETVNCLGACAIGPIVVVDGRYHADVRPSQAADIIREARAGRDGPPPVASGGDPRVFPVAVSCARCNHTLLDADHLIDGHPSIRVTISFARKHGWLRLSSLYGSYAVESEHEIPWSTVANFFCPHCHAELRSASVCAGCNAPLVPMIVRGGGMVQICSRRGCREHRLDVGGANL